MSTYESKVKLCNRISALLMALMLILQFLPYWHYGEEDALSASINGFVWFPHHHAGLTEQLTAQNADYSINPVAYTTVGLFVLSVLGAVFCLRESDSALCAIFPVTAGLLGLTSYLSTPAFQAGAWRWVHVTLFVLMVVTGIAAVVLRRSRKS